MTHTKSAEEQAFYVSVGAWIKMRRRGAKLSHEELGARLGVHRNTVLGWEQGASMTAWMYTRVCREFGKQLLPVSEEIQPDVLRRIA
jgi:transcriptional regulator with XRE-family HTH domain